MAFKYKQGAVEQTWDRVVIPFTYVVSEAGAKTAKECQCEGDIDNINPAGIATVMLLHPITGQQTSAVLPLKMCTRVPRATEPTSTPTEKEPTNAQINSAPPFDASSLITL